MTPPQGGWWWWRKNAVVDREKMDYEDEEMANTSLLLGDHKNCRGGSPGKFDPASRNVTSLLHRTGKRNHPYLHQDGEDAEDDDEDEARHFRMNNHLRPHDLLHNLPNRRRGRDIPA